MTDHKVEMLQHSERANEEIILVHIATDAMHEGTDATAVDQYITLNHSASCRQGDAERKSRLSIVSWYLIGIVFIFSRTWLAISKC